MKDTDEIDSLVIAFRAPAELATAAEEAAAREGLSRSDIARRALIRDLERAKHPAGAANGRAVARGYRNATAS